MVCLGNICRSPLAEGVLKSKLSPIKFRIDSAGTSGFHIGESPDYRSIKIAAKHGIDISLQKSRAFKVEDFNIFDRIYVMDRNNLKNIKLLAETQEEKNKVCLILENEEVPDPYYGGGNGFEIVYNMLDKACDKILKKIE